MTTRVLVYTRTTAHRHDSIQTAVARVCEGGTRMSGTVRSPSACAM